MRVSSKALSPWRRDHDLVLPEWAGLMHGPNEGASEAQLKQALKIYILAIFRLMELDL